MVRFGKASRLNLTFGIQNEWITSFERSVKRTVVSVGTVSVGYSPSTPSIRTPSSR